jgi:K+-transporting ATPase ATPase A chain
MENPTPLSNLLEVLAIILLPVSVACMVGAFTGSKEIHRPRARQHAADVGDVDGGGHAPGRTYRQRRVGGLDGRQGSAHRARRVGLWAMVTTQTSNGSVNAMHDSLAPLTGMIAMSNMLVNAIWGGVGCGLQQFSCTCCCRCSSRA